ncbi:GFA family protein [Paraconexibacter sp. AEG42_29]
MLTGHCLCGQITYQADAEPALVANCHCTDCRRQTASAFSTVVGVPAPSFTVTGGELAEFITTGTDHGQPTQRKFCGSCGTPIVSVSSAMPDLVFIKAGSLDDPTVVEPQLEVWTESALQQWAIGEGSGKPAFARGPG